MFNFVLDIQRKYYVFIRFKEKKPILCMSALCVPILFTDLFSSLLKFKIFILTKKL